jgi:hypothetical protein
MNARRVGVAALLIVGTLFWALFGLGLWAQRQALNTDNWVDTSSDLLANEHIRTALGTFLVERLYRESAVQERLQDVLPPQLDRLAAPAAAGLKELARRNAPRILGTEAAANAWRAANRRAHQGLLTVVRDGADRDVSLDLRALLGQIADSSGLPPGAVDRLPPDVANLEIAPAGKLDTANSVLNLLEEIPWVLCVLAVAAFAGAVFLGADRRHGMLNVGACLIVAGLLLLALRRIGGNQLVDALADAPNARAAAHDAWSIATGLMVNVAEGSMLLGLFVVSGSWLAGPAGWAADARRLAAPALREHAGGVRAGLAVALLLLVLWGPVPWTTQVLPVLIFTLAAFLWLEWIRRRTFAEMAPR